MSTQKGSEIFCEDVPVQLWDKVPNFSRGTVDLWKISIQDAIDQKEELVELLSPEERGRASRYHQSKDESRFVIGKGLTRRILSLYIDCSPADIIFKKGLNNKPYVHDQQPLEFNVSYSGNFVILGVSPKVIGVDIEYIRPDFDYLSLLNSCFMGKEIQLISSSSDPRRCFFRSWTRKEALLKATALGLGDYLTDFSCLDGRQFMPEVLSTHRKWFIKSFLLGDDYWISFAQDSGLPVHLINPDYLPGLS